MAHRPALRRPIPMLREFLESEAAGGLVLMAAAAVALLLANSPLAPGYQAALHAAIGPLSLEHWINDALMVLFFLLVGMEIKREFLGGELASWPRRALPGFAAAGGMAVPALIYAGFTWQDPAALRGWAIPSATDIAFALGVISLLGDRVPSALKVFLAALAIIDDLGAVLIIAVFYTDALSLPDLGLAALVLAALAGLNRAGVRRLWPYLLLGLLLWLLVFRSGVHATIAGVALALTIPLRTGGAQAAGGRAAPLLRLEHHLQRPVAFLVVPVFGLANAGLPLANLSADALTAPLTLGVGLGLLVGKFIGVFGSAALVIRLGLADLPMGASWPQMAGVSLLCGIGFTMSLFIGMLAFEDTPLLLGEVKLGIMLGSLLAGLAGWTVLRLLHRGGPSPGPRPRR
ncbi:Na+/H+ antiporter NhaA [Roseicella frigidaeris]|uniref:Na(+)/H(+) antiporter NhaA n=1 Tax=Roseicella frigidaeris TaxID=2230885 RepID=A0A327M503_9PROT|nr:Na+/H+ antiporter NhaA [Roseicella frigidaeris]RAI58351.1 Na+/H+ antiporter NhaA [Roseicella frigidaeris]